MNNKKVLVGLSGGIDSAVSAWLLKRKGYEVLGVVLRLWENETDNDRPWTERTCCHVPMVSYLCDRILDIPLIIHDSAKDFQERVVNRFKEGYASGTTPNPCTSCNADIKIRTLLDIARDHDIPSIATGHYAAWNHSQDYDRTGLKMSPDKQKDQSYFLSRTEGITPDNFLLPLGEKTKNEVRDLALKAGFPVSGMLENQEACFVSEKRVTEYLDPRKPNDPDQDSWTAVTTAGKILGSLRTGIGLTRGQRRGHGIAGGDRLYILSVNPVKKEVLMGSRTELLGRTFEIDEPQGIMATGFPKPLPPLYVRFRSTMGLVPCQPHPSDSQTFVLDDPHDGIVSGQIAAFYDKVGILIGSGRLV